jgi:hypothetical protein
MRPAFDTYGTKLTEEVKIMAEDSLTRWHTCRNVSWMLNRLLPGPRERRRRVLIACAFCRRLWHLLETPAGVRARQVVEGAERWACGVQDAASVHQLTRATRQAEGLDKPVPQEGGGRRRRAPRGPVRTPDYWAVRAALAVFDHPDDTPERVAWMARQAVRASLEVGRNIRGRRDEARASPQDATDEAECQCDLIRDVVCPPLGRELDPADHWLRWDNGTVPMVAKVIALERKWADLPILADALQDAGCRDEAYLAHCRHPGPHTVGCWLIDLLTNDMGMR